MLGVYLYILDIPDLQQKYMYADSFGCAKVFWADLNIEILGFLDMDNPEGKKTSSFWHTCKNNNLCQQSMVEQLSVCWGE